MGSDQSKTSVQVLGNGGSPQRKAYEDKDRGKPLFVKKVPMAEADEDKENTQTHRPRHVKEKTMVLECESIDSFLV